MFATLKMFYMPINFPGRVITTLVTKSIRRTRHVHPMDARSKWPPASTDTRHQLVLRLRINPLSWKVMPVRHRHTLDTRPSRVQPNSITQQALEQLSQCPHGAALGVAFRELR